MDSQAMRAKLLNIYDRLFAQYGAQHWWPAQGRFEIIVGAILTQSAAWRNVEKAISHLNKVGALSPEAIRELPVDDLARLVHPSGYYNVKALKLKSLVRWLGEHYQDNLDRLFSNGVEQLRSELLSVYGVGEETADSIILYAANKPVFVIDAYTKRILSRLGMAPEHDSYAGYQELFMNNLPADARLFNEYHALLVNLGKNVCRRQPLCQECCLSDICQYRH